MVLTTAALGLALAAPASAAVTRYASADAAGEPDCSVSTPCSLTTAVGLSAGAGDVVVVLPGNYSPSAILNIAPGVDVHGADGAARPVITGGDVGAVFTLAAGSSLRHVEVTVGAGAAIESTGGRAEDVIVRGGAGIAGVVLHNAASLVNSVVSMNGDNSQAIRVRATTGTPAVIRHVTASAVGAGTTALDVATISEEGHATMINSIMRGDANDVSVTPNDGALTSSHSNYRAAKVSGSITSSVADQTGTDPVLDATFHQQSGSPTIDAGTDDGFEPLTDFDGEGRKLGLAPDIGADERPPPVVVNPDPTPTPPTPTPTPIADPGPPELVIERITVTANGEGVRTLVIRAKDPDAPMNGVLVDFGNGMTFGESACRTAAGGVFADGRSVEFKVPVPPAAGGSATVEVRSGGCALPQSETRQVSLTPTATTATAPATAVAAAVACRGTTARPRAGAEKVSAATVVCLMNQVRRAARLKPLKASKKLTAAARAHNNDMLARHFYAHEQPPGPALATRLKKAKWRGRGAGENIGLGSLSLASPQGMLAAWMNSPPHKANILNRKFRFVGVAMQAKDPLGAMTGAALYTVDFGTSK